MTELRPLLWISIAVCLIAAASLVSAHERHYSKRRLILLQARIEALERAFLEDRTI